MAVSLLDPRDAAVEGGWWGRWWLCPVTMSRLHGFHYAHSAGLEPAAAGGCNDGRWSAADPRGAGIGQDARDRASHRLSGDGRGRRAVADHLGDGHKQGGAGE